MPTIVTASVIFARPDRRDHLERDHLAARHPLLVSSHALIGGLLGAGITKAGSARWSGRA